DPARINGAAGTGADDRIDGGNWPGAAGTWRTGTGAGDTLSRGHGHPGRTGDLDVVRIPDSSGVVLALQRTRRGTPGPRKDSRSGDACRGSGGHFRSNDRAGDT